MSAVGRHHHTREMQMTITDQAKEKLQELLRGNPGKLLRVVFEGFG